MRSTRIIIGLAALVLLVTALSHFTGANGISSWLEAQRGNVLRSLWYVPAIDWVIVVAVWAYVALRPHRRFAPVIWLTAIIPLVIALMLLQALGADFPGVWMLLLAVGLAVYGSMRLHQRAA